MKTKIDDRTTLALIFGKKGTGKTSWMKNCIEKIANQKTILIIDILDNFENLSDHCCFSALEFSKVLRDKNYKNKIIRLNTIDHDEICLSIEIAYRNGNISVYMDESDFVFNRAMADNVREVVLRGRNQGIDLILSSLRPNRISPDVRNQCDLLICFPFKNKLAIESICNEFGNPEILKREIPKLENHDYLKYEINTNAIEIYSNDRVKALKKKGKETAKRGKYKTKKRGVGRPRKKQKVEV